MHRPPLVLSVFATFATGGPQVRFAAVARHLAHGARHAIIAMDGRYDCAERLPRSLDVVFPEIENRRGAMFANVPHFRRLLGRIAPDVLVTHNWGSVEWALANATSTRVRHVHIEDGFGPEEAVGQIRRRVLARRLLLRQSTVVLPSMTLVDLATSVWRLPAARLRYIPNGVNLQRLQAPAAPLRGSGDTVRIGTVAALRAEKNLGRLLGALRRLRDTGVAAELTIVGDGPERGALHARAADLGLADAVRFAGALSDPAPAYRDFDLFALSSDTEQMPLSILEAMGAGLPVAATAVGDVPRMLAPENRPFVCAPDEAELAGALGALAADAKLRRRIGAANRSKAEQDFDERTMFRRYRELLAPAECDAAA